MLRFSLRLLVFRFFGFSVKEYQMARTEQTAKAPLIRHADTRGYPEAEAPTSNTIYNCIWPVFSFILLSLQIRFLFVDREVKSEQKPFPSGGSQQHRIRKARLGLLASF
jgi:hypothetical protein